ncbi:hypothetical protein ANO11243_050270 [Dothideomycetidae sp. 11243]|nr:hypothetical protein ANO11243_050270 [fungal sp. No.11243]
MFLEGAEIQAVITLIHPNYSAPPYQAYLIMVAIVSISAVFNIHLARHLPMLEGVFLLGHLLGFALIILTLGILSPKVSASSVFTTFESQSGYSSLGLGVLVGQMSAVYGLIGSDGAVHMAEETKNAAINVPRSIAYSYLVNGILGFAMLVLYLFCLLDVDAALSSQVGSLGFPYMHMFVTGTGSNVAAACLGSMVLVLGWAGATSFLASTSRQTFAFARDSGLPFSNWLAYVDPKYLVPTRSIMFTWAFTVVICLIKIGSSTAFNAIISLQLLALLSTYAISIACLIYRRLRHDALPPCAWSLGRFGLPVNIIAFTYSLWVIVFCCFPSMVPVSAANFNWAPVIFTGVLSIAGVYYLLKGRKKYEGPVVNVSLY